MDWFLKLVRIAGVNFPGAASLVQLQAEIDSEAINISIKKLSDPISFLNMDVQKVSREIYKKLKANNSDVLCFSDEFYSKYSKSLAALDSKKLIKKIVTADSRFPKFITLPDASFVIYMCKLDEDHKKMTRITSIVDSCEYGTCLDGYALSKQFELPVYVIRSIFSIYESKGYGILSNARGTCQYVGRS